MNSIEGFSLVLPSVPAGNHRRIELASLDLWIIPRIDNVFVYPEPLNIEQFKMALSRAISICPIVAGRFLKSNSEHYFIEMSDNGVPITYTENQELTEWPLSNHVVVDLADNKLAPFIDCVQTMNLLHKPSEESLVRLKLTRIVQSNEWVLGTSWAHILGDAESNLVFLRLISRFYQQLEPIQPLPIVERRLWREDEADQTISSFLKELSNAIPLQEAVAAFFTTDMTDEQINLHFTGKQIDQLRELAGHSSITRQDALTSYLIVLLNKSCAEQHNNQRILQTFTAINYRGISNSIAPAGLLSNAVAVLSSDEFQNPTSMRDVAQTIRRSIINARDPNFLERCVATINSLMKKITREGLVPNLGPFPNGITVNSNYRFDWATLVDFGFTDRCRFYTSWTTRYYCRVFRLNPRKNGNLWLSRDSDGAEVAFRIPKSIKDTFLQILQQDIIENFSHVEL